MKLGKTLVTISSLSLMLLFSGCSTNTEDVSGWVATQPATAEPAPAPVVEEPAPVVEEPAPAPAPEPVYEEPAPAPEPVYEEPAPVYEAPAPVAPTVSYASCKEVKAAGAAPIHLGDPGWDSKFDRDGDNVGCES